MVNISFTMLFIIYLNSPPASLSDNKKITVADDTIFINNIIDVDKAYDLLTETL